MSKLTFSVATADWHRDAEEIRAIRTAVFIKEQHVPPDLEWDDEDPVCLHLLARTGDGRAIGTARLLNSGQIGRLAVLKPFRGIGAGTAMLKKLLDIALARKFGKVFLNAQIHAVAFYQEFGFTEVGAIFNEAGIPHIRMDRKL